MAYVVADPELMTSAASDLVSIGSNVSAAHMMAAARTVAVIPAAADEVSAGIAHLFSRHAQDHQALAGQASAFHEEFVQRLTVGAGSYANIEALSAISMSGAFTNAVDTDFEYLFFAGAIVFFLGLVALDGTAPYV